MSFKETFTSGSFCLDLQSKTKAALLAELVDALSADGTVKDRDDVLRAVMEREERGSTGMQNGIAVPHGKTMSVDNLVTAFGISRNGVDFDSLDGQPCRIFILTVSSALLAAPHMHYLAEISRALSRTGVRERILSATTREELIGIVCGE